MAFIYVITNDINGKQYVGKTNKTIEERFKEHIRDSRKKRCEKRPLYSAINKYGIEHFHISVIEECSAEESADREIYWIDKLSTYGRKGYNATRGGDSKKYYDYEEIVAKYQELHSIYRTALFFECADKTVKAACRQHEIPIINTNPEKKKPVAKIDKDTNKVICIYSSLTEASLNNSYSDKNASSIARVCSGQRQTALGYKWSWV